MTATNRICSIACSAALLSGMAVVATPAEAGFFDQLFGAAPSARSRYYQPDMPDYTIAAPRARRPKRSHVAEAKPVKQKPTDIMHDDTLQNGDAVMTKTGMQVYVGDEGGTHDKADFAKLDEIEGMPKKGHDQLAALDPKSNDPLRHGKGMDTLSSGRSAAVAVPVTPGVRITDPHGKSVRYVGP